MNRFEKPTPNEHVKETLGRYARPIITSIYTADPAATAAPATAPPAITFKKFRLSMFILCY